MTFREDPIATLQQAIVDLHFIAAQIDEHTDNHQLSINIRRCADQLAKEIYPTLEHDTAKGDQ